MSVFEALMILSFGLAWPFSIYRSWRSRSTGGKSPWFLAIVLMGYISGLIHKFFYNFDAVIWLYAVNSVMVAVDLCLYFRNASLSRKGIA